MDHPARFPRPFRRRASQSRPRPFDRAATAAAVEVLERRRLLYSAAGDTLEAAGGPDAAGHGWVCGCPGCTLGRAAPALRAEPGPAADVTAVGATAAAAIAVDPIWASVTSAQQAQAGSLARQPLSALPQLSSFPGASANLYLDFDGDEPRQWGAYSVPRQAAFSYDGDPATFNDAELTAIRLTWEHIADYFSPFNLNVTTVNPGADDVPGKTLRLVMGASSAWDPRAGNISGTAYVNGFTQGPNWGYVFGDVTPEFSATVAAHEAGHGFGLLHQSYFAEDGTRYEYREIRDGPVAPLMGSPRKESRMLWWTGPTTSPTAIQDDMAVIARAENGFGYRPDEHGDSPQAATPLTLSGGADGRNPAAVADGVVHGEDDQDWFAFSFAGGPLDIVAHGPLGSHALDPRLELRTAGGAVVATVDEQERAGGWMRLASLPAGEYRLGVMPGFHFGDGGPFDSGSTPTRYGEAGQYHLRLVPGDTKGQVPRYDNPFRIGTAGASRIEFEDFDLGSDGTSFHEDPRDYAPSFGLRLLEPPDVETNLWAGPVLRAGLPGEWVEYTVDVAAAGRYDVAFDLRLHSTFPFHLELDGHRITEDVTPAANPNGAFYQVEVPDVELPAGQHVLRFVVGGESNGFGLMNFMEFTYAGPPGGDDGHDVTLRPAADAYVRDGSFAAQNFGAAGDLQVKNVTAPGYSRETYLRFDLSQVGAADQITSAQVRLFGNMRDTKASSVAVGLHPVADAAWGEPGLTWDTRPAAGATAVDTETVSGTAGAWYTYDVTQYLKQQKAAGAAGVSFALKAPSVSEGWAGFSSDEAAANQPELVVSRDTPPPPPPPPPPDRLAPTVLAPAFVYQSGPPHRLTYRFSEPMDRTSLQATDVAVRSVSGGAAFTPDTVSYDAETQTATFTFAAGFTFPNGNYRATLTGVGVTDAAGNALATDHAFEFFALTGDINRDRFVDGEDFAILASNFGKTDMTYAQGDLTGEGKVDGADFSLLASNFGLSVPPSAPPPALAAAARPAPSASARLPQAPAPESSAAKARRRRVGSR